MLFDTSVSLNKEHCTAQTVVGGTSHTVSAVKDGGVTNLAGPFGAGSIDDKCATDPHNQASDGKDDGCQKRAIGKRPGIWYSPRGIGGAKSHYRGNEQTSLGQKSQSKPIKRLSKSRLW